MKIGWIAITLFSWIFIPIQKDAFDVAGQMQFSQVVVDYKFNDQVTFEAIAQPLETLESIEEITIQIQPVGEAVQTGVVKLEENGKLYFTQDLSEKPWHPFISVRFQYLITYTDGTEQTSEPYSFIYEDNRFHWKSLNQDPFTVHYQEGELDNGQIILNTALAGLQKSQIYFSNISIAPIHLYAYNDPADLQSAIPSHKQEWAAGYTYSTLNIILVSAPPGPGIQLELERQIPHEIAHVFINEISAGNSQMIPVWLSEGLATLSEIYPNPDNQRLLGYAVETDSLISIESLCFNFPPDVADAYLAYAESASFVNFLYKRYGTVGLGTLLQQYINGVSCQTGVLALTGESLFNVDQQWRQQVLGIDTNKMGLNNLIPYMTFLFLILFPLFSIIFLR